MARERCSRAFKLRFNVQFAPHQLRRTVIARTLSEVEGAVAIRIPLPHCDTYNAKRRMDCHVAVLLAMTW